VSDKPTASQVDLIGTIVHDLKTPISSIKSFADLIDHSGDLNERQTHYLQRIMFAADNMSNLVNDLLDLVWIESGMEIRLAPCNIRDVVRTQIHLLNDYAKYYDVGLTMTVANDIVVVQADERRLNQVVGNLIGNAIKYNQSGGNVTIDIRRKDTILQVSVTDTGLGISEKDLPHVFDRFFRAPMAEASRIEGSGLGLSIAKAIVERHGGAIGAESTLGQGSIFWFTLPV
jgi:two-component system phosphate regulon sensor histidine kinase PhoR